jgi:leader peptidase (prepilin peptidase)/N-methyltransferase
MAIFGLVCGSFLAMLIYRLPLSISLINPKRSICTQCQKELLWYENIPLFSYLILKGCCSKCGTKISVIYPIVELLTSVITVLLFFKLGVSYQFLILLILFYIMIVLSFIDFEYKAVPDYLLIFALVMAIVYIFVYKIENISTLFIFTGAIVLLEIFVTFYIQNIKARLLNNESFREQKSLGEGDIPIFAIIGGILGMELGLLAIFLSAIFAIIPAIINMVIKKDLETPFIPFLSFGFIVVYLGEFYILDIINIMYGK